jgi:hypothetical protein
VHRVCLVIPLAPDESEGDVRLTVESFRRHAPGASVYFGVDEDFDRPWAHSLGSVVRIRGFGVGRALDAAVAAALKDSCEFVVKSDAHVYFEGFELPLWLEVAYHCTWDGTCYGASTAEWPDMGWLFTWGRYPVLPMTCEPVHAYPREVAETMYREFGCAYCAPYWGSELYDFTLTACRRYGWCARQARWRVRHRGRLEFPRERYERQLPREPWMDELPGNPYFTSMTISWQVFLARHAAAPERHPKYDPRAFEVAKKYFGHLMRFVPGYGIEFLYYKLGVPVKRWVGL